SVIQDVKLAGQMGRLHRALENPSSPLEVESRVYAFLGLLLLRPGLGRCLSPSMDAEESAASSLRPSSDVAIRRVEEYLRANPARRISLTELAALTPWTPYHFLRVFGQTVGLPPHEYLLSLRIERAKQLLRREVPIAEVSQLTGFADQSHL